MSPVTTTFDFGAGPVPAHRHPNGGGWVADIAQVAQRVRVGPNARVAGGNIEGGTIWGGTIWGGTIRGGNIEGGNIWGGTIWGGTIWGGIVWGGTIWGGTIRGGNIEGGNIWGGTIWGGTIWGGIVEGGTIWGGDIRRTRHVLAVGFVGSEDQWLTLTRTDEGHRVAIGCWHPEDATIDDIADEVQRRCPDRADEYAELMPMLRRRVAEWDAERTGSGQ